MHRLLIRLTGIVALLCAIPTFAAYPDKPIKLVVPFAPGGGTDILARVVADHLGRSLGVPVIVDNKAGAGGTIGTDLVAKSKPDGYTLLMGTNATLALAPGLYRRLPYDPVKDLTPVASVASGPSILVVSPSIPANDIPSLIAYVKANPRQLNYGSAGNGSMAHIATALMNNMAGLETVHIPFKGGAAAIQELVAGRLQYMIAGSVETIPLIDAGRVRALAVTTKTRFPGLPNLPTMSEAGIPGYEITNWFGMFSPAGLPAEAVDLLAVKVNALLAEPAVREAFLKQGVLPESMSPAGYRTFVRNEVVRWTSEVRQLNIAPD